MDEIQKILVPVDGSKHSQKALDYAVTIAKFCNASIGLLHVIDLNLQISAFEQVSTGGYIPSEIKEAGWKLAAQALRRVPQEVEAGAFVEIGSPAETILRVCEAAQYDFIIMGSRGLNGLSKLFLGSVSQYMIAHAQCPVLIVR